MWREKHYQYKSWATAAHTVTDKTWDLMSSRYGLGESDILAMEREVTSLKLGGTLRGDRWVRLVQRDILGAGYSPAFHPPGVPPLLDG